MFCIQNSSRLGKRAHTNSNTAIAVRGQETGKFSDLLRLMYTVPSSLKEKLSNWIAVPKSSMCLNDTFFAGT